jgi:hypothetical protein
MRIPTIDAHLFVDTTAFRARVMKPGQHVDARASHRSVTRPLSGRPPVIHEMTEQFHTASTNKRTVETTLSEYTFSLIG